MRGSDANGKMVLIACGILREEILHLVGKNGWPVAPLFLPSSLHIDFARLRGSLERLLRDHGTERRLVFYGACHPMMEQILEEGGVARTRGQNCVEILLGRDLFSRELEQGAFFLFEDWAVHWDSVMGETFRGRPEVMRSIFRDAHRYLLGIRTPCSGDFAARAEEIGRAISLEVRWLETGLEHLERSLAATIGETMGDRP